MSFHESAGDRHEVCVSHLILIVAGFLRPNLQGAEIARFERLTMRFISRSGSEPLYFRDLTIAAPPQRPPPPPPTIDETDERIEAMEVRVTQSLSQLRHGFVERLSATENKMVSLTAAMSKSWETSQQRRVHDINTIQGEFNSTITCLCSQINDQINSRVSC